MRLDLARERRNGRRSKEAPDGDRGTENRFDPPQCLDREQRFPAELEEVAMHPDSLEAKQLAEDPRQLLLDPIARRDILQLRAISLQRIGSGSVVGSARIDE